MKLSRRFINPASDFFSDFDQFFNRAFGNSLLPAGGRNPDALGVYEADGAWHFRTDLPGFAKEEVDLQLEDGVLTLKAEKADGEPAFRSTLNRSLRLPENVDVTGIEAKLENGVLEVVLPKVAPAEPESLRIEIN